MFWSVLLFAAVTYGLGHGAIALVTGRARLNLETHAIAPGIGLAVFAVLTILFNPLGVPLVWWVFLLAAALVEAAGQFRASFVGARHAVPANTDAAEEERARHFVPLLVSVLLGAVLFAAFLHGEFLGWGLHDDDSWEHASSAKYVAIHKTYSIATDIRPDIVSYIEPYPPGYPALMGVLHQLNDSVSWTLRFFNVLLIGLSVPWFYLAMKEFLSGNSKSKTQNSNEEPPAGRKALPLSVEFRALSFRPAATALWMTGVLWAIPCFMSHFIWAQTMAVTLFFPAFYALDRARREPCWWILAAVAIAGVGLSQPSAAAVFALMVALYWIAHAVVAFLGRREGASFRPLGRLALAALVAAALAAAFYVPQYVKFGHDGFFQGIGKIPPGTVSFYMPGTSHGGTYSLSDYVWAPAINNKINQPTGIGPAIVLALAAGIALALARRKRWRDEPWMLVAPLWLALGVYGVESNRFPVALFPHRFWVFLAIPVAMLAGEFFAWVAEKLDWKSAGLAALAGLALGGVLVFSTAAERLDLAVENMDPRTRMPLGDTAWERCGSALDLPNADLEMPIKGVALMLLMGSLVLTALAAGAGAYRLAKNRVPDGIGAPGHARDAATISARPGPARWVRFGALVLLIAGVVMTSADAKARLNGFGGWPMGVRFYIGPVTYGNGRPVLLANGDPFMSREYGPHLQGFLRLPLFFPRNSPILSVNGSDDHLIGFDMLSLPYDNEIRRERKRLLAETNPSRLDASNVQPFIDLARAKGLKYLLLDSYYAADHQYWAGKASQAVAATAAGAGLTQARFNEIERGAAPSERERPVVKELRRLMDVRREQQEIVQREIDRAARLREIMARMPALKLCYPDPPTGPYPDTRIQFGIAIYRID